MMYCMYNKKIHLFPAFHYHPGNPSLLGSSTHLKHISIKIGSFISPQIFEGSTIKSAQTKISWTPQDGPLVGTNGVTTLIDGHYKTGKWVLFHPDKKTYSSEDSTLKPSHCCGRDPTRALRCNHRDNEDRDASHGGRHGREGWSFQGSRAMSKTEVSNKRNVRWNDTRTFTMWMDVVDFLIFWIFQDVLKCWLMSVSGFFYINGPLKMRYFI